jgi:hypothetical protein
MSPIQIALSQVGVKEQPKGSNRGPMVDKYTGGNAVPWCALFVLWCFREAGLKIPGDGIPKLNNVTPLCNVEHFERVFKEHEWFYMAPKAGDIVFFQHRGMSDKGKGRHIGIVVKVVGSDKIEVVDGNWSDSVVQRIIKIQDSGITGFGRLPA